MDYKKKLTDIFLRKQQKPKKQLIPQKPKIQQFDESYFQAQLICDNIHTTLIKATAIIKKGSNQGEQIPLNCKWYIKNQFDFKQIQEIKASCFQPCLQDVGNIICVQIEPQIQGMNYTGITIMKQSDQLKMDKKLQSSSNQYFISKHLQMQGKIQVMYSQDPKYEKYEYPLQVSIVLSDRKVIFNEKSTKQLIAQYEIEEDYPQIDFIRKSFNSILFNCNKTQSMKLSLSNNFNRDLFSLIIRSIPAKLSFIYNQEQLPQLQLSPCKSRSDNQGSSQQITKLILKIDEQHKQINNFKRINEQITTNYHLQRNAKISVQNQIQKLKTILQKTNQQHTQCKPLHLKIKQVLEENKFYFGQISLMKNELKQKNSLIKQLKNQMNTIKTQKQSFQSTIQQLVQQPKAKILLLQSQLNKLRTIHQQMQSENQSMKQKINRLQDESNVLKKKFSSIVSQKSLPGSSRKSPNKMNSFDGISPSKDCQIVKLKMQVTNLEMLLKHKAGEKGGSKINMNHLVNSLTEKIAEKQLQIEMLKKINKQITKNMSGLPSTQIK